jgi:hypothetical protein
LTAVHNYFRTPDSEETGMPTIETHERFQNGPRHTWESRI